MPSSLPGRRDGIATLRPALAALAALAVPARMRQHAEKRHWACCGLRLHQTRQLRSYVAARAPKQARAPVDIEVPRRALAARAPSCQAESRRAVRRKVSKVSASVESVCVTA